MPSAGSASAMFCSAVRGVHFLIQGLLQFPRHHVLDLVRIVGVHTDHAQIVADDGAGVMIGQDLWEFQEGGAFIRFFDMRSSAIAPLVLARREKNTAG